MRKDGEGVGRLVRQVQPRGFEYSRNKKKRSDIGPGACDSNVHTIVSAWPNQRRSRWAAQLTRQNFFRIFAVDDERLQFGALANVGDETLALTIHDAANKQTKRKSE